jgi:RNA polymerase sigma-70 factor, ECF subfamily
VDAELTTHVQAARGGGTEAWDALFQRYQLPLFAYVHGLTHDREAGLDIVQEAFVNAVRHIGQLRDDAKFGAWLFGIARQKCVHHWRRTGRDDRLFDRQEDMPAELPGPEDDAAAWLVRRECEDAFAIALGSLPAAQREVVVLHCLEEFPLEEIAGIAAVPLGTVKSRLHHARRKLRELLEEHL